MKFIIDANLPYRLKEVFAEFDVIHTLDLDKGNLTPDRTINFISEDEKRILITKDVDFLNSFTVSDRPYKLMLVQLGNMKLADLINYFISNREEIVISFEKASLLIAEVDCIRVFGTFE